jgi:hypothetical protein
VVCIKFSDETIFRESESCLTFALPRLQMLACWECLAAWTQCCCTSCFVFTGVKGVPMCSAGISTTRPTTPAIRFHVSWCAVLSKYVFRLTAVYISYIQTRYHNHKKKIATLWKITWGYIVHLVKIWNVQRRYSSQQSSSSVWFWFISFPMTEMLMGERKCSLIEYAWLSTARSRVQSGLFKRLNYSIVTDTPLLLETGIHVNFVFFWSNVIWSGDKVHVECKMAKSCPILR